MPISGNASPTVSAARAAYLDNIDASLKELFYEHFGTTVDDLPGITASGDMAGVEASMINNILVSVEFGAVDRYLELDFGAPTYIKKFRYNGSDVSNVGNRYKVSAYVAGAWEDCLTDIVDIDTAAWDLWRDLPTPQVSSRWRLTCTTFDTAAWMREIEFLGVRLGA